MSHFALEYAERINEFLHSYLVSTWFYKQEIYEVPDLCTALLITYDDQVEDQFEVHSPVTWECFLERMSKVKPDWADFWIENMQGLAQQPHKRMGGWEGRTIYIIRGGSNPEYWPARRAGEDMHGLLSAAAQIHGPLIDAEAQLIDELIPPGKKHYRMYEHFVKVAINYLFVEHLGEAKPQVRTEPGNEGTEIRDLVCQNRSESGFWKDLKDKYSCSEILFDAKNKQQITRNDLRQVYCYLKPAIGLWGFIVCRSQQPDRIHAYNRTLFKNFTQTRGVLILTDDDLRKMIKIRMHGRDPSDYLRDRMSEFVRSV